MNRRIPLTALPRELSLLLGRPGPSYRQCYNLVLSARIEAEQDSSGRWSVEEAHLPRIAAAMGLTNPHGAQQRHHTASSVAA